MQKLSCGYTLEELVKRRKNDFQSSKAAKERQEAKLMLKSKANRKMKHSSLERSIRGQVALADKSDKEIREFQHEETNETVKRTRRNAACCLDPLERQARILCVLKWHCDHHGKKFCFPSQDTILKHLKRWYGLEMSKSCLNADLRLLEARGHIRRKRRLTWGKFTSTLYSIPKLGLVWWRALQKAFGLFKTDRFRNMRNNNVLLRNKGMYKGESCASTLTNKLEGTPDGEISMA